MKLNKVVVLFTFILLFQSIKAQQIKEKFIREIEYLSYKPIGYEQDTLKKWPLLIFLHGSGQRGSDLEKVKVHGPPMLIDKGKEFPFMVISPQAGPRGWNTDLLYSMILDFIKNNRVDQERIYLTGLSMGGRGTWALAQAHPELFAAIVPICGYADTSEAWKLRHMPVWCFHGEKDHIVPISTSQNMVKALENLNAPVKFTVYPEEYHESWIKAYNDPKLYEWLLAQTKFKYKAVKMEPNVLNNYTGKYHYKMQGDEGIFEVFMENHQLIIDLRSRRTPLIPFENNKFFIQESQLVEFQFLEDENGKIDRIMLYTNEINTFLKVK
jgi:predicted esterase